MISYDYIVSMLISELFRTINNDNFIQPYVVLYKFDQRLIVMRLALVSCL